MSKLKEKANPEIEFSNDPMMKQLHIIQMKISKETRNMSGKDLVKYFKEKSQAIKQK